MTKATFKLRRRECSWLVVMTSIPPDDMLGALGASIDKWEFIEHSLVDRKNLRGLRIDNGHGQSCALCHIFPGCSGCPVIETTGLTGCRETPYSKYDRASMVNNHAAALQAARDEIAFLKSLRGDCPQ